MERNEENEIQAGTHGERGTALLELALVLPILLTILLLSAEIGMLLESRLIVTNVSREGGSIGSRQTTLDAKFLNLLTSAGQPLNLGGTDGKIIVTRITSGDTENQPLPRVVTKLMRGGLVVTSSIDANKTNMGLTPAVYNRLVFNRDNGTADIAEITVVEVYFKHKPYTPFKKFLKNLVLKDGDGTILASRSIF